MKTWMLLAVLVLAPAVAAAQTPSQTPPASNADAGKKLFVSFGCWTCHGYEGQGAPGRE